MKKISKINVYHILGILFSLVLLFVLFKYASCQSFWLDELDWTVEYLSKSNNIIELIQTILENGTNLPLYYIVMFPIYKIAPFGELWLLIPNFIVILLGVFFIYKAGNKLGKNLGFTSLCISVTSFTLIVHCAFEFRPYAFLFCFSAFALYRYICKIQEPKKSSNLILYALSIILLAFTHWFGCLIIAFYFLLDVILWFRKKHKISFVLPYIALLITFLPYLILMLVHNTGFNNYWVDIPVISNLFTIFAYLLSDNFICVSLFILGIIIMLINLFKKDCSNNIDTKLVFILIGCIIWALVTIFVYSRFINPNYSLWVSRYFLVILPHIFIITSIPIVRLLDLLSAIDNKEGRKILIKREILILFVILITFIIAYMNYAQVQLYSIVLVEPYREVSEIIANTPKAYEESSVLLTSCGKGYITYYFEKKGVKLPSNIIEAYAGNEDILVQCVSKGKNVNSVDVDYDILLNYETIYMFQVHEDFNETLLEFINKNYDIYPIDQVLHLDLCIKKNRVIFTPDFLEVILLHLVVAVSVALPIRDTHKAEC